MSVRRFGDVAIVVGVQRFSTKDGPPAPPYRITHTFARVQGAWKLVQHQSTIIPPQGASNISRPAAK